MFDYDKKEELTNPVWAYRDLTHSHRRAHDMAFLSVGAGGIGQPMLLIFLLKRSAKGLETTQKELASILKISAPTLTVSLKSLEKNGYVKKIADEVDKRRNHIEITEKGATAARGCLRCLKEIDTVMYQSFSDVERQQVADYFSRMTVNLNNYIAERETHV